MQQRFRKSFYIPILTVLRQMGGIGKAAEVIRRVIDMCGITEEEMIAHGMSTGNLLIRKRVDWARYELTDIGYLHSSGRGIWELTDKGRTMNLESASTNGIHRELLNFRRGASAPILPDAPILSEEEGDEDVEPGVIDPRDELLGRLLNASPYQFEKICRHLLTRVGFENVEVTQQTKDGGFDGTGLLVVNPFVKTSFIFECKRYADALVPVKDVRALQGKISQGVGEKGAIITTSYFTSEARKEASAPKSRIELVEQDELIDLFVAHRVGVRVAERIEEIDDDFFRRYQG